MPEQDRNRPDGTRKRGQAAAPLTELDLQALLCLQDARPDERDLATEAQWIVRHLGAARRALRADFDASSLAVFECLLAGERVSDVAARFGKSGQAVYKIKQRVRRRLAEIVRRSIAIEQRRESARGPRPHDRSE